MFLSFPNQGIYHDSTILHVDMWTALYLSNLSLYNTDHYHFLLPFFRENEEHLFAILIPCSLIYSVTQQRILFNFLPPCISFGLPVFWLQLCLPSEIHFSSISEHRIIHNTIVRIYSLLSTSRKWSYLFHQMVHYCNKILHV